MTDAAQESVSEADPGLYLNGGHKSQPMKSCLSGHRNISLIDHAMRQITTQYITFTRVSIYWDGGIPYIVGSTYWLGPDYTLVPVYTGRANTL